MRTAARYLAGKGALPEKPPAPNNYRDKVAKARAVLFPFLAYLLVGIPLRVMFFLGHCCVVPLSLVQEWSWFRAFLAFRARAYRD